MRTSTRLIATVAASVLVIGGLAACAPASPEPTLGAPKPSSPATAKPTAKPTVTPTPTPETPVAARISIDGDSISVQAADASTIVDIPFSTDAATAASQLGGAIGLAASVTTTSGDNSCAADQTLYDWGGLVLRAPGSYAAAPGATFLAAVTGASTTNGLPVVMPSGHGVGAAVADVLAANPGVAMEGDPGGNSVVYFDVLSGHPLGDMDTFYGAEAFGNGGVITSMVTPIFYYYDC